MSTDRPHAVSGWWGVLLLGLLLALASWWSEPPGVVPADSPPTQVSAARAMDVLDTLIGDIGPHPIGSPAARTVESRIVAHLRGLGLHPQVTPRLVCRGRSCARVRNVVALIPGTDPKAPLIGLMAHYDSVRAGSGWGDDGSGVAAILEVARALRAGPVTRRGVLLILNEGEEVGLLGAHAFVRQSPWADRLGVVVNLEARGTRGPSYLFETAGPSGRIAAPYAATARAPRGSSLYAAVYRMLPNDTDVTVLAQADIPAANLAFLGNGHLYHTPLDDRAHLDPRSVQHHTEQALGLVRGLDAVQDLSAPAEHDVFFDMFGLVVVRWPASWASTQGAVALLGLLVLGFAACWRAGARWWTVLVALAAVLATAALPTGIGLVLEEATGSLGLFPRHAPGLLAASFGLTAAAVWLGLGALTTSLPREPLLAAAGLLWGGLSFALGEWLPEAIFLALLPAGGLAVALAVRAATRDGRVHAVGDLLAVLPAVLWLHLTLGLQSAVGVQALFVAAPAGLTLTLFLHLAPAGPSLSRGPGLPGLVALAILAGGLRGAALTWPGPTPARPDAIVAELWASRHPSAWIRNATWPVRGREPSWPREDWTRASAPASPAPPTVAVRRLGERDLAAVDARRFGEHALELVVRTDPDAAYHETLITSTAAPAGARIADGPSLDGLFLVWHGPLPPGGLRLITASLQDPLPLTVETVTSQLPASIPPPPEHLVPIHDGVRTRYAFKLSVPLPPG